MSRALQSKADSQQDQPHDSPLNRKRKQRLNEVLLSNPKSDGSPSRFERPYDVEIKKSAKPIINNGIAP